MPFHLGKVKPGLFARQEFCYVVDIQHNHEAGLETAMNEITDFLKMRRSVVIRNMNNSAVPASDVDAIIDCGLRVPDHGALGPWRIVMISEPGAGYLGTQILAPEFKQAHPEATDAMLAFEAGRFTRTGLVLAVISSPVGHARIPAWEMHLSAGAVCQNLLTAALSLGYGAQWVTEWYADNDRLLAELGGNPATDRFAGFIYVGHKNEEPQPRRRPQKSDVFHIYTPPGQT